MDDCNLIEVELEALRATFSAGDITCDAQGNSRSKKDTSCLTDDAAPRRIYINVYPHTAEDLSQRFVEAQLLFTVPSGYPELAVPRIELALARGLGDKREKQLLQALTLEASKLQGELMLGHMCEVAKDFLTAENHPDSQCAFCMGSMQRSQHAGLGCSSSSGGTRAEDGRLPGTASCGSGAQGGGLHDSAPYGSRAEPAAGLSSVPDRVRPGVGTWEWLLKLPCFHAFHRACFTDWWVWQQSSWREQERQLVEHTGATSVASLLAEKLPPREPASPPCYRVGCPICRLACPLASLPQSLSSSLLAALPPPATEDGDRIDEKDTVEKRVPRAGKPVECQDRLGGSRLEMVAEMLEGMSDEDRAALRAMQERHRALFAQQHSRGGIIGSQPPPLPPPPATANSGLPSAPAASRPSGGGPGGGPSSAHRAASGRVAGPSGSRQQHRRRESALHPAAAAAASAASAAAALALSKTKQDLSVEWRRDPGRQGRPQGPPGCQSLHPAHVEWDGNHRGDVRGKRGQGQQGQQGQLSRGQGQGPHGQQGQGEQRRQWQGHSQGQQNLADDSHNNKHLRPATLRPHRQFRPTSPTAAAAATPAGHESGCVVVPEQPEGAASHQPSLVSRGPLQQQGGKELAGQAHSNDTSGHHVGNEEGVVQSLLGASDDDNRRRQCGAGRSSPRVVHGHDVAEPGSGEGERACDGNLVAPPVGEEEGMHSLGKREGGMGRQRGRQGRGGGLKEAALGQAGRGRGRGRGDSHL